jgi:hypothetical protein
MFLENQKEKPQLFKHFKSEISKIFFLKAIVDDFVKRQKYIT